MDCPGLVVERKSISDLIGSLTAGRSRLMREIERMKPFRFRAIIIEGTRAEIERGDYLSVARPESILQSLAAIEVRHNIHIAWGGTPDGCARIVERWCRQFARGIERDYGTLQRAARDFTTEQAQDEPAAVSA